MDALLLLLLLAAILLLQHSSQRSPAIMSTREPHSHVGLQQPVLVHAGFQ